jgi:oxygen-independent coproporphyrinogen-3 oxidase
MLSFYIHIPFCVSKCHYCGFYSTPYTAQNADQFVVALAHEIGLYKDLLAAARPADTIYIGGGTPSVLSPAQFELVLSCLELFPRTADAEWTIEANPGSLSRSHLSIAKKRGVNRISLGVQSLSDGLLEFLGRPHTARDATEAFRMAREAGFDNIGVDLIYGIPGQTDQQWMETLCGAIEMGPQHISAYSLSLDDGSRFKARAGEGSFPRPDDDMTADQYERGRQELKKAGYEQYEVSNFSLPGSNCRHNLNYWARGEYQGLGPGAWTFMGERRYRSVPDVREYSERLERGESLIEQQEILTIEQAARETLMLGLRTVRGVELHAYEERFGTEEIRRLGINVGRFRKAGFLEVSGGWLKFTPNGFLVSNEILQGLFP